MMDLENTLLALWGLHSYNVTVWTGSHWPRAVIIDSSLMSRCGLSHESAEDGCKGQLGDVLSIKMKGKVVCLSNP